MKRGNIMKNSGKKFSGFIIAGILLVLVAFAALALQFGNILNSNYDKVRFTAPGSKEITLDEAGRYILFYEYKSNFEGRNYNTKNEDLSNMRISISEAIGNNPIDWYYSKPTIRYVFKNAGVSWAKFDIPEPTKIKIDSYYEAGDGPEIVMMVAGNFVSAILKKVFLMIVSFFGLIIIGAVLFIIPLILRSSQQKKADKSLPG